MRPRYYQKKGARIRQPVQYFKQNVWLPNFVTSSTTVDTPFTTTFSLADLTNSAEFQALYDQYKIMAVKFTLMPKYSQALNTDGTFVLEQPQVHTVIDYDSSPLITMADAVQYPNMKTTRGNSLHKRYLKPKLCINLLDNTGGNVRSPTTKPWIDCANNRVLYRGILGVINPGTVACDFDLKMTYYMAFKNVR